MEITAIEPYYRVGTATLTNGQKAVTGQGTQWLANVVKGDQIYDANGLAVGFVDTVNSNTSITLLDNWGGTTQAAGKYTIYRVSDSVRVEQFSQRLLNLLLGGNLSAEGDLVGAADRLSYYTGPGAKALTPLTSFARTLLDDANAAAFWVSLGATAPPDVAFRRGNVLGPVSLAGGVPTGALIEYGTNANGSYMRFADGTQICWLSGSVDGTGWSAVAWGAYKDAGSFSLPASFVGAPSVVGLAHDVNIGGRSAYVSYAFATTTTVAVYLSSPAPVVSGAAVLVRFIAIGRWN